jgi:DNA invertase Pin-like site-specific DNA recombinase
MNDNEPTNRTHPLITPDHLRRLAVVYCRQSSEKQVEQNTGSTQYQRNLAEVAREYGWQDSQIIIIDDDLGKSGSTTIGRTGWQRLEEMIEANQVGAVFAANISRLARNVYDFEVFRMRAALHRTLLYSDGRLSDPANSNDTFSSQIMAMVASFENRKRAELMMQSRLAKARRGEAVSKLPVGWIKGPDGKYDFDPETKDTIRMIIETFWQTRSVWHTVKALAKAGIQIPCRNRGRIHFFRPTIGRVRFILTNPAYAGVYVYGKSRPESGGALLASGQSKRVSVSEEHWIKHFNHHPAYMTLEEQEEIKSMFQSKQFEHRSRPGRGPALMQGLLRCGLCGATLQVNYPSKTCMYSCDRASRYAETVCMTFTGSDLERCILRELFRVLKTPPIEMLKSALEAERKKYQTRLSWIESERERLSHEESVARERAELARGRLESVYLDSLEKLENVLQKKKEFEQKIAREPLSRLREESDKELDELCRIAGEVPSLWQHEEMTNKERKEILRCLIDHIVVNLTTERIDATIAWKGGDKTEVFIWRRPGHYHLFRELHAQKLTAVEIREHLSAGKTSTGQEIKISLDRLYFIMHKMGLRQHRFSLGYISVQQKAAELYREGRSAEWIAKHFEEQSFVSASGKPWTAPMVDGVLRAVGEKPESSEDTHRRLIAEALARGLNHAEIAREFNQRNIRLRGRPPWTERKVAKTCRRLGLQQTEPAVIDRVIERRDNTTARPNLSSSTRRRRPASIGRHVQSIRTSAKGTKGGRTGTRQSKPLNVESHGSIALKNIAEKRAIDE